MSLPVNSNRRHSYFEARARERIKYLVDVDSFTEFLAPTQSRPSPHLAALDIPGAFDDGVVIGRARLNQQPIFIAAQEGQFMGGAVGEIHGAKIVGLLRRALCERPHAVLLLIDSGGVRLHEANAGLIAISEIMRAVLDAQASGIPVLALVGGSCGAFGGMGIVAKLCSNIIMSEEGRLALSGPEVIETVAGVEEFDSKDRALVWRVTGGKHRYIMCDCIDVVEDDVDSFRIATIEYFARQQERAGDLAHLRAENLRLRERAQRYADCRDGVEIWKLLGIDQAERISLLTRAELITACEGKR